MAQEIKRETKRVFMSGNSRAILIPSDIAEIAGLEEGVECVVSLQVGKHGFFVAIWRKNNQPKPRDV